MAWFPSSDRPLRGRACPRGLVLAMLVLGLVPLGCVDRAIHDRICGDGRRSAGELCLGQGERREVAVEGLAPLALRVADFDGDGHADVMVLGLSPAGGVAASTWPGDGEGDLRAPLDPRVTGCSAHPVPGSIDDDAITDLLVDDCAPSMSLFRGTASGVFEPAVTVATGVTTSSSALLDLDADGLREVVVLGPDPNGLVTLSVAERLPTTGFAPPVLSPVVGPPVDFQPTGFGVLDLDGDPLPDLLLVHGGRPEGLALATGEPGLRFSPATLAAPPGLRLDGASVRDLDGDGRVEVLVASFEDEALVVLDLPAAGVGSRLTERLRTEIPGLRPGPTVLADLDDDGREDLLRVQPGSSRLEARLGEDGGRFGDPIPIELDVPVDQIAVADLDEDGALDIVVGSFEEAVIRVLLTDP